MKEEIRNGLAGGIAGLLVWAGLSYAMEGRVDIIGAVVFVAAFTLGWTAIRWWQERR